MMTLYVSPYRRIARRHVGMDRSMEKTSHAHDVSSNKRMLAVNVKENDEAYTIQAMIPGVEADDINVEILKNMVTISGEFGVTDQEAEQYLMCELPSGRFNRLVTLPTAVDVDGAEAHLKDGLFSLHIPKSEEHRPKSIKIKGD